jgi:hypothetical protein
MAPTKDARNPEDEQMALSRPILMVMLFLLMGTSALGDESQGELRDRLLRSHRASVQVMRTIRCSIDIESATGEGSRSHYVRGQYVRSGSDYRITETYSDGRTEDIAVRDGHYLAVGRSKDGTAAAKGSRQQFTSVCDVWKRMLLDFPGKRMARIDLADLFRWSGSQHDIKRVNRNIVATLTLEDLESGPILLQLLFNEDVNYLVTKITLTRAGRVRSVSEIEQFAEPEPGLFFPIQSRLEGYGADGKLVSSTVCKISDLHVNAPISRELFEIKIPAGTVLADRTRDVIYKVDHRGNPIGSVRKLPLNNTTLMETASSVHSGGQQTKDEEWAWWQWLVAVCVALLAGSAALLIIRQRRGERNTKSD